MNTNNQLYVNILMKDGSTLHNAIIFKNKNPKTGEYLIAYTTKEEIENILDNTKDNHLIYFSTNSVQGKLSSSKGIESYSIITGNERKQLLEEQLDSTNKQLMFYKED